METNVKTTIKEIILQFQSSDLPKLTQRDLQLPLTLKKVISLIGVRRCGKTYLLFDTINQLVSKGIPKKNMLYINFEDERLQLSINELDLILQAWYEIHNGKPPENQYFFFDEIQNIQGWEKFIRRIYDTVTPYIFVTGSNSAFLAKEIATSLRGRTIQYEVFPFSFFEYIKHKNIDADYYLTTNKAKILNAFREYLTNGSFPELVELPQREQNELLRSYFYVMLYKDLIERYKISSTAILKHFVEKLADNLTKPFSINKIYKELRSKGLHLDKNLLYELIIYIENIYLSFKISKYDYSYRVRSNSFKKCYFIDNGLINVLTHRYSEDKGKMLENAVFLFLRSEYGDIFNDNIFYYKDKSECDFVVFDRDKANTCIQVSYDISQPKTRNREIKGLIEALNYFDLKKGFIITGEQEEEIKENGKTICIKPAYKFMIDKKL